MTYQPQDEIIARHIDYYWIVEDSKQVLSNPTCLYAYPGITPDLIILLDGFYEYNYLGKNVQQHKSILFSFIHEEIRLNLSKLGSFILVKFKSRALSSLQPFVNFSSEEIMKDPLKFSEYAFDGTIEQLPNLLKNLTEEEVVHFLDAWFLSFYKSEREGFVIEMAEEICPNFELQKIMNATNYSYSTIERYFKRETGLTPKKYQTLRRYKAAIAEIFSTKNEDWMQYVAAYKYYDQSHFVRDIKGYTGLTPNQLLVTPSFISYRPKV